MPLLLLLLLSCRCHVLRSLPKVAASPDVAGGRAQIPPQSKPNPGALSASMFKLIIEIRAASAQVIPRLRKTHAPNIGRADPQLHEAPLRAPISVPSRDLPNPSQVLPTPNRREVFRNLRSSEIPDGEAHNTSH